MNNLLINYEKYLKKNQFYNKKNTDDFFNDEYVSFFFEYNNSIDDNNNTGSKLMSDEIHLFKKLFMITLSLLDPCFFFKNFKITLFRFFNCFMGLNNGLEYFKQNFKDKTIFDNYFIFLYEKIKIEIALIGGDTKKKTSCIIFERIKESDIQINKLFYKILVKSGIDYPFLNDNKHFFYYFFTVNFSSFSYKNKIILEKVETVDPSLLLFVIDSNYPFLYSCSTTKEPSLLEIEKKALLKAVEIIDKKEIVLKSDFCCYYTVENLRNWDIQEIFDKRFMIYDDASETTKILSFKKVFSDRKKYLFTKISFIYYLTLFFLSSSHHHHEKENINSFTVYCNKLFSASSFS